MEQKKSLKRSRLKNLEEYQSSKKSKLEVKKEHIAIERCQSRECENTLNSIQNLEKDNNFRHNEIVNEDCSLLPTNKDTCFPDVDWNKPLPALEIIEPKKLPRWLRKANLEITKKLMKSLKEFMDPLSISKTKQTYPPMKLDIKGLNKKKARAIQVGVWRSSFEKSKRRIGEKILDGKEVYCGQEIPESSKDFWEAVFDDPNKKSIADMSRGIQYTSDPVYDSLTVPFTLSEVEKHISKINRRKIPGEDNITKDKLSQKSLKEITDLLNYFVQVKRIPKNLKLSNISLYASSENAVNPKDFRPFVNMSLLRYLFSSILFSRAAELLNIKTGKKSNDDFIINLRIFQKCIEQAKKKKNNLTFAFIDLSIAFDSVYHHKLIDVLARKGLTREFISLIADMYNGHKSRYVQWSTGDYIHLKRGLVDGDPFLPLFFNLIISEVLSCIRNKGTVKFKKNTYNFLMLDDSLVLFAQSAKQLISKVNVISQTMKEYGLSINFDKSRICNLKFDTELKKMFVDSHGPKCLVAHKEIKQMEAGDKYKVLNTEICAYGNLLTPKLYEINLKLERINKSLLQVHHKFQICKDNFLPQVIHQLDSTKANNELICDIQKSIYKYIIRWLNLPKNTPESMLSAEVKEGGLGITNIAVEILKRKHDRFNWISQNYNSSYCNGICVERLKKIVPKPKLQTQCNLIGLYKTEDGKGLMNHNNKSGYQSRWISNPLHYVEPHDWKSMIKTRLGLLKTPVSESRNCSEVSEYCPFCNQKQQKNKEADLNHIMTECVLTKKLLSKRYNKVVTIIKKFLLNGTDKYNKVIQKPIITKNSKVIFIPHIVFSMKNSKPVETVVIKLVIETDDKDLGLVEQNNSEKYDKKEINDWLAEKYGAPISPIFVGVVLDWRGAWAPRSHELMLKCGIPDWMLELVSIEVLKGSHEIWRFWNEKFEMLNK